MIFQNSDQYCFHVFFVISLLFIESSYGIYNGEPVDEHKYYQASLQYHDDHYCTGVVLSADKILTSARCLHKRQNNSLYQSINVHTGSNDLKKGSEVSKIDSYKVNDFRAIEKGDYPSSSASIGIAKLDRKLSKNVMPVTLDITRSSHNCHIVGWSFSKLVKIPYKKWMPRNRCQNRWKQLYFPPTVFCGEPTKRITMDDMGAPLMCDNKLSGVFIHKNEEDGPLVFADTLYDSNFIKTQAYS